MKTKIFDLKNNIDVENLEEIASIIKKGGLVAIPTETVYGLAADGLNPIAVKKIFSAKNRPMDNPLILHISNIDEIYNLSRNIKKRDIEILDRLWPGPLTVVVKKSDIIPDEVSAGLDSVAIRIPEKDLTRKIIEYCERPLAAPSANLSTKPSPTNIEDVLKDMQGRIDAVVDGGESEIGIESTVIDLTGDIPKILRPGFFTREILEKYWDKVDIDIALKDNNIIPKSPGQKYKHYAPNTKVLVIIGEDEKFRNEVKSIIDKNSNIGLMVFENDRDIYENDNTIYMGNMEDLTFMGKILFNSLRKLDEKNLDLIVIRGVEEVGYGLSIMNRLKKSASHNIRRI